MWLVAITQNHFTEASAGGSHFLFGGWGGSDWHFTSCFTAGKRCTVRMYKMVKKRKEKKEVDEQTHIKPFTRN